MDWWYNLVGYDEQKLVLHQMVIRAIIIFFIALVYIRIAGMRTFGKKTIFDQVTVLMMGAILGRAVVTNQPFFSTLIATLVLMLLHRFTAWITFRSHKAGLVLKGSAVLLVKNGELQKENMSKTHITVEDIRESLRLEGHLPEIDKVKECHLERSGNLSIVMKE